MNTTSGQSPHSLDRLYRAARIHSLSRLANVAATEIAKHVKLDEVFHILNAEERFKKHPLTDDELPFDRLLLAISPTYRQTRVIAHKLGIRLVRQLKTETRGFYEFTPLSNTVSFTPIRSEMLWALDPKHNAEKRWKNFKALRKFATPVFHELNHAIFYRLVRFKSEHPKRYLYFTESLAWMRDRELSEELGPPSLALLFTAILYQAAAVKFIPGSFIEEKFNTLLYMTYARYLGNTAYGNLWRPDDWQKQYLKETSDRVILPKLVRSKKLKPLRVPPFSPSQLSKSSELSSQIFHWYREVFTAPEVCAIDSRACIHRLFIQGVY